MSWVEYDGVPPLYDGDDPSRMTAFAALGRWPVIPSGRQSVGRAVGSRCKVGEVFRSAGTR